MIVSEPARAGVRLSKRMPSERQPAGATAPNDTRTRVKYVRRLGQVTQLTLEQRDRLEPVEARYVFRANDYYLGLIDWDDPEDPIRQLIIPREEELSEWGTLDASNEESVTVARGVQHKYTDTVLLLCNEVCGAYCRYCFRKRLFMDDNAEVTHDITEGLRYIADHPEVTNVLLTGGDPLLMSTRRLVEIFEALRGLLTRSPIYAKPPQSPDGMRSLYSALDQTNSSLGEPRSEPVAYSGQVLEHN